MYGVKRILVMEFKQAPPGQGRLDKVRIVRLKDTF